MYSYYKSIDKDGYQKCKAAVILQHLQKHNNITAAGASAGEQQAAGSNSDVDVGPADTASAGTQQQ